VEVTSIRISVPLFRYESVVHHFTPRKPTVLERAILRVHDRLARNESYNAIRLDRIFEEILCVAEPDALIQPALEQLVMLGVFRCRADFSSLRNLSLRDLERTPTGDAMLRENMLPAVPVDNEVAHLYDPIRGVLVGRAMDKTLRRDKSPLSLSEEPFKDAYPSQLIAQAIPQAGYDWWHPTSRIDRLRRVKVEVFWGEADGKVCVSDEGRLSLQFPDPSLTSYVNRLDEGMLFEQFIQPVLKKEPTRDEWPLGKLEFRELRGSIEALFPISDLAHKANGAGRVRFVKDLPGLVAAPAEAPARAAVVVFGHADALSQGDVRWNPEGNGVRIRLSDSFPLPGGVCWDGNGRCFGASVFDLYVGNSRRAVPLGYAFKADRLAQALPPALLALEGKLAASGQPDNRLAALFWRSAEEVWKKLFADLSGQQQDFIESVKVLQACRARFQKIAGNDGVPSWDEGVCGLFARWLGQQAHALPLDRLAPAIAALAQCQVKDPERLGQIAGTLLEKVQPPTNVGELEAIFKALEPIARPDKLPFPSLLYTAEVLADYASRFGQDGFGDLLHGRNFLEKALGALHGAYTHLQPALGSVSLADLPPGDQCRPALERADRKAAWRLCNEWVREWDNLLTVMPGWVKALPGTLVLRINRNVERLRGLLNEMNTSQPPQAPVLAPQSPTTNHSPPTTHHSPLTPHH